MLRSLKTCLNVRGFGLLQLLIAVSMGSIVSMAVVNTLQHSGKEQKKLILRNELLSLKNQFANVLHQDQTFINTIAASENINMGLLTNLFELRNVTTSYSCVAQ